MEALILWSVTHPEELKKWSHNLRRQAKRMWDGYNSDDLSPDWDVEDVEDVVVVSRAIMTIEVVQ